MKTPAEMQESFCPSAQPEWPGAVVFGVSRGTAASPEVGYLPSAQEITPELLKLAAPVEPSEVFRFAAPCLNSQCVHFRDQSCTLASRIVQLLPDVEGRIPPCAIRPVCRWWRQEGVAACRRCPQVVTHNHYPSEVMRAASQAPEPVGKAPESVPGPRTVA